MMKKRLFPLLLTAAVFLLAAAPAALAFAKDAVIAEDPYCAEIEGVLYVHTHDETCKHPDAESIEELLAPDAGIPCDMCGRGTLIEKITYGSWINDSFRNCIHGAALGKDVYQKRSASSTLSCNSCNFGTVTNWYEYRWVCQG